MRSPHLLGVESPAAELSELVASVTAAGHRVGWLELGEAGEPPESLRAAARLPVARAVAAGGGRTVAVTTLRGAPVLRDLLRQHFLGCRLVLVRGGRQMPLLRPHAEGFTVELPDGRRLRFTAEELARALARPRPW